MRILLVGCSTETHDEVTAQLRAAGGSVQVSAHAADALHKLGIAVDAATPFEVVIVDRDLAGIDAQMFAELVREDERLSYSRLVLIGPGARDEFGPYADAGYAEQVANVVDAVSLAQRHRAAPSAAAIAAAAAVPDEERPSADALACASILLVEDNEINMEVAREMIEKIGYRCDHAVNGYEAVEAAKRSRYDLVLMDCQMPGMDGYQAAHGIRTWEDECSGSRRVPIIAVTAHAMKGDRERCLAAGMDDYMTKPVEVARLAAMIAKWLAPQTASGGEEEGARSASQE